MRRIIRLDRQFIESGQSFWQAHQYLAPSLRGYYPRKKQSPVSASPSHPLEARRTRGYRFSSANQLTTTLIGSSVSSKRVITRNRCPSPVTTKRFLPWLVSRVSKRSFGVSASNAPEPVLTSAAISFLSASVKNNSLPSRRHCGSMPPSTETCHLPLICGKVAT